MVLARTQSINWFIRAGKASWHAGECLHSLASGMNPYKSVINIIAKTLSAFDDDQLIPCYGFGDLESKDGALRSFSPAGKPLQGLHNVLAAYEGCINSLHLSGPTSLAPAIYKTIEHVRETGGQYHILLIIADGQVRSFSHRLKQLQACFWHSERVASNNMSCFQSAAKRCETAHKLLSVRWASDHSTVPGTCACCYLLIEATSD